LEKFDEDGNGKLEGAEREAAKKALAERRKHAGGPKDRPGDGDAPKGRPTREEILAKFDEDGNGELDGKERAKARAAFRERHGGKDKGGEGAHPFMTAEMREKLLDEFDADGNGKLEGAEREKAGQFLRKKMAERGFGGKDGGRPGGPGKGFGGKGGDGRPGPGKGRPGGGKGRPGGGKGGGGKR